jgi:hypothetical protein
MAAKVRQKNNEYRSGNGESRSVGKGLGKIRPLQPLESGFGIRNSLIDIRYSKGIPAWWGGDRTFQAERGLFGAFTLSVVCRNACGSFLRILAVFQKGQRIFWFSLDYETKLAQTLP